MQAPGTLDLTIYQGATWDYTLTWRINEQAKDLTNYSARMMIRTTYSQETPEVSLSTSEGGITLGGTSGTIYLVIDAATTAELVAGQYIYDLELISGAGAVTRLVEGTIIVDPEVTR